MLVLVNLRGSEENKVKQVDNVVKAAVLLASGEVFTTVALENVNCESLALSKDNVIIHDNGGAEWDSLPWFAAVGRVLKTPQRPASVDVIVASKTIPKNARFVASAILTINVDDEEEMLSQLEDLRAVGRTLKDARRYNSLINLGTMRQIGSAGFNGRERIKNDHYFHMTFDMWSTGYEGAYTDDYCANANMFNIYTDALINNFKNGMDGRTE